MTVMNQSKRCSFYEKKTCCSEMNLMILFSSLTCSYYDWLFDLRSRVNFIVEGKNCWYTAFQALTLCLFDSAFWFSAGLGMATLAIGLVFRMTVSFLTMFRTSLNLKERLFIPFAWLPKATVQVSAHMQCSVSLPSAFAPVCRGKHATLCMRA